VFVTDSKEINALALPGGFIVFHRGLLERARSAEELQGVLAHEMAHVIKRHGVLQLAQNIGFDLLVQQIQGNENRVLDALIRDSGQLLGLKFSRDHERAADDLGWDLLEQAQVNPQGMVDFFAAMKAEQDANGPGGFSLGANLLSTHPTPLERIDRLRQRQAQMGRREFRSYETDFQALRETLNPILERP
jgi:predicted Zn-dependent protease